MYNKIFKLRRVKKHVYKSLKLSVCQEGNNGEGGREGENSVFSCPLMEHTDSFEKKNTCSNNMFKNRIKVKNFREKD